MEIKRLLVAVVVTITTMTVKAQEADMADSVEVMRQTDEQQSYEMEEDTTNKPEEIYDKYTLEATKSKICLPIDIDIDELQQKINKTFGRDLLYEDNNIEDDGMELKAWKRGDFKIDYVGDTLKAEIPIKVWIKKRVSIGGLAHTDREGQGAIRIRLSCKVQISKNWNLMPKTRIEGYEWIEKPTFKIVGMDMPITYIADMLIKNNSEKLESMVDNLIKENLPIHTYVQNFWDKIQDPIQLNIETYEGWLRLEPTDLTMTPIRGANRKIETTFYAEGNVIYNLGVKPTSKEKNVLPVCRLMTALGDSFEVNLLTNISYDLIDTAMKANLTNENIGNEKHPIFVDSTKVYGSGEKLAISMGVHGFVNGMIYATAKPYYDAENVAIRIKDVGYSLKSRNTIHKALSYIIKPFLRRKLEKDFAISLGEKFDLVKKTANEKINNKWGDDIYTTGSLTDIEVEKISICEPGLQIGFGAKGNVKAWLKE